MPGSTFSSSTRFLLIAVLLLLGMAPTVARAGMPMPLPDDVATVLRLADEPAERVQVISFFLLALLLSALAVQWLWNGLRREFSKLPRLSYVRSLLMTVAWGLLFCIVLVMISGARELMTPGAWQKNGTTYQLQPDQPAVSETGEP